MSYAAPRQQARPKDRLKDIGGQLLAKGDLICLLQKLLGWQLNMFVIGLRQQKCPMSEIRCFHKVAIDALLKELNTLVSLHRS